MSTTKSIEVRNQDKNHLCFKTNSNQKPFMFGIISKDPNSLSNDFLR